MEENDGWKRLIEALDAWTRASEIAPGRIQVSLPESGTSRQVVVVMTPRQWDDMSIMRGDFEEGVQDVKLSLLRLQPHEQFAVYSEYQLEPSTEPTPPEPPDFTPEPGGAWVSRDHEGRASSRFADWSEPDERRR